MKKFIYLIGLISILGISKSYSCKENDITDAFSKAKQPLYVFRNDVPKYVGFDTYNSVMDKLNELNAKCPNKENIMLRIAVINGVNQAAQLCLTKILLNQLVNDLGADKVHENDVLNLLKTGEGELKKYVENTYIFNTSMPQEKQLQENDPFIKKLINCENLTDLFSGVWNKTSLFTSWFGISQRQYYIEKGVLDNLTRYLNFVEKIALILLSNDTKEQKRIDASKILLDIGESNIPDKNYFISKVTIEMKKHIGKPLSREELAQALSRQGQGVGPKSEAQPDGLYSLSVSLRSLTK